MAKRLFNFFIFFILSLPFYPQMAYATPDGAGNDVFVGNVGIGTATPQAKLAVISGNVGIGTWTSDNAKLTVSGGDLIIGPPGTFNNGSASEDLYVRGNLEVDGSVYLGDAIADTFQVLGAMDFASTRANQIEVTGNAAFNTTGGTVGIGTTLGSAQLEILGNSTNPFLRMSNTIGSGDILVVTSIGNVGIGSAAPMTGFRLDVGGDTRVGVGTFDHPSSQADVYVRGNLEVDGNIYLGDALADTITIAGASIFDTIYTAGDTFLAVTQGNVGIGSTSSDAQLEITRSAENNTDPFFMISTTFAGNGDLMMVNSAGNVGIGTNLPKSKLAVLGNVAVGSAAYVANAANNSTGLIVEGNVGIGTVNASSQLSVANGQTIGSGYTTTTAPSEGLLVQGNVGIGSTAPGQVLDVAGNIRARGVSSQIFGDDNKVSIAASAASNGDLKFLTNSTEYVRITSVGNVGVGTLLPRAGFAVANTATAAMYNNVSAPNDVYIQGSLEVDGTIYGTLASTAGTFTNLEVTNNTNLGTNGTGNVGIGTTMTGAPSARLAVIGGNVGIGTISPQTALAVTNGNVGIGTWTAASKLSIAGGVSVGSLTFTNTTAPTDGLIVSNNVGIGSSAPSQMLDVNGDVRVGLGTFNNNSSNNDLYVTGNLEVDGSVYLGDAVADTLTVAGQTSYATLEVTGNTFLNTADGNVGIGSTVADASLEIVKQSTDPYLMLSSSAGGNGDVLMVMSGGNVGIGTVAPEDWGFANLNVKGTVAARALSSAGGGGFYATDESYANYFGIVKRGSAETGNLSLPAGGVELLSYQNDMAIYTAGSKYLAFGTNGVERIRVDSEGNVGIGTNASNGKLTVIGGNVGIGTTTPQTALAVTSGNVGIGTWTAANNRLSVLGGNVGIGTGTTHALLEVVGDGAKELLRINDSGQNDVSPFVINSAGNVGIGTTSPGAYNLSVGAIGLSGSMYVSGGIDFGGNLDQISASSVSGHLTLTSNQPIKIQPGSATAMYFQQDGNIGIGSLVPGSKLDVNGDVRVGLGTFNNNSSNNDLYVTGNLEVDGSVYLGDAVADTLTVAGQTSYATLEVTGNTFLNTADGNVGIGSTVADASLEIVKQSSDPYLMLSATAGGNGNVLMVSSAGNVGIGTTLTTTSGLSVMNGNVGIGTWVPSNALHILSGSIQPLRIEQAGVFSVGLTQNSNHPYWQFVNSAQSAVVDAGLDANSLNLGRGNVQIVGSDTPATAAIPARLYIKGSGTTNSTMSLQVINSSSSNLLVLRDDGNVGIGTDMNGAAAKLSVIGGNVGIGTTTPQAALAVTNGNVGIGTWTATSALQTMGTISAISTGSGGIELNPGTNTSTINLYHAYPSDSRFGLMWQGGSGGQSFISAVGNGATDSLHLQVGDTGGVFLFEKSASKYNVSATELMRLNVDGNLGIGSAAPGSKLNVNGDVRVGLGTFNNNSSNNDLYVTGNLEVDGSVYLGDAVADTLTVAGQTSYATLEVTGNTFLNTADGNVGIGSTAADASLEIVKQSSDPYLMLSAAAGGNGNVVIVDSAGNVGLGTTATTKAGLTVMNGNVGIGTWTSFNKLEVVNPSTTYANDDTYALKTGIGDDGMVLGYDVNYATGIIAATTRAAWKNIAINPAPATGAKVGIGTFNPVNGDLEIFTTGSPVLALRSSAATTYNELRLMNDQNSTSRMLSLTYTGSAATSGQPTGALAGEMGSLGTAGNYPLYLSTGSTARMTIHSSGNIGIGTFQPTALLQTRSSGANQLLLEHFNNTGSLKIYDYNSGRYLQLQADNTGTSKMLVASDANAVSPAAYTTNIVSTDGSSAIGTRNLFAIQNGGAFKILLDNTGNLGIGTNLPRAGLSVASTATAAMYNNVSAINDAYVQGSLEVDGTIYGTLSSAAATLTTLEVTGNTFLNTADGNVGIGSTVADASLEIVKQSSDPYLMLSATAGGNGDILMVTSAGNVGIGTFGTSHSILELSGNGAKELLRINDSGQNDMSAFIVTSTGNVGIGTIFPQGNLDVIGVGTSAQLQIHEGSVTGTALKFRIGGAIVSMAKDATNVMVLGGTNIPMFPTGINVGVQSQSSAAEMVAESTSASKTAAIAKGAASQTADILKVLTSGDAVLFNVSSAGNVGIGSATPGSKLDVNGDVRIGLGTFNNASSNNDLYVTGNLEVDGSVYLGDAVADTLTVAGQTSYATLEVTGNTFLNTADGNVGIGSTVADASLEIVKQSTDPYLMLSATAGGNGDVLMVSSAGNVGIGTISPSQALRVVGNMALQLSGGTAQFDNGGASAQRLRILGPLGGGGANGIELWASTASSTQPVMIVNAASAQSSHLLMQPAGVNSSIDVVAIKGASGLTGNLQAWSDSSGGVLSAINSAGNVGIGTTMTGSPSARLSVIGGNVGIGTTTPQAALAVTNGNVGIGTWTATSALQTMGTISAISTGSGGIELNPGTNTSTINLYHAYPSDSRFGLMWQGGSGGQSFISAVGNGATDSLHLQVGDTGGVFLFEKSASKYNVSATELMRLNVDGNLGIGSAAPGSKLNVNGDVRIGLGTFNNGSSNNDLYVTGNLEVDGSVYLGDAVADTLTVAGITNYATLEVTGNTFLNTADGNVGIGSTAADASLEIVKQSSDPYLMLSATAGGNGNVLMVNSAGNVGIGTTLTTTAGLSVMNGNVGIGTWVPASALTVKGNITPDVDNARSFGSAALGISTVYAYTIKAPGEGGNNNLDLSSFGSTGYVNITIGSTSSLFNVKAGSNTVFSVGNVGVSQILNGTQSSGFTFTPANGGQTAIIKSNTQSGTSHGTNLQLAASDAGDIAVYNGSDLILTPGIGVINGASYFSRGNVGIGTTMSSATAKLAVIGGNVGIGTTTPQAAFVVTNGNVGIGTWTADATLKVGSTLKLSSSSTISTDANTAVLTLNGGSAGGGDPVGIRLQSASGTYMEISHQGGARPAVAVSGVGNSTGPALRVTQAAANVTAALQVKAGSTSAFLQEWQDSSGNVLSNVDVNGNLGIGSTAPGSKLDVNGDVRIGLGTFNNNSSNNDLYVTGNLEVDGSVYLGDAVADTLTVAGTTSYATLEVTGNTFLNTVNGNVGIGTTMTDGDLSAKLAVIGGNVGIGTTAPQAAFVVTNGNVGIGTWTAQSSLQVIGSQGVAVTSIDVSDTPYTAAEDTYLVLVDCTTGGPGDVTVNLPIAANVKGRVYQIKKVDADVSAMIINADSGAGELVDGQASISTTTQYQSFTVVSDGVNWWII